MPDLFQGVYDGVSNIIILAVVAFGFICLQFFFSWKWDEVWVKLIPTLVLAALLIFFFLMAWVIDFAGWDIWIDWVGISLTMLIADGIGWLAYTIYRAIDEGDPRIPEGM